MNDGRNGLNDLSKRLYTEGWTRQNHPDYCYWEDWQNLGYKFDYAWTFKWETPCGLQIDGNSMMGRQLAFCNGVWNGVWYCPENNNSMYPCPYHKKNCPYIPEGFPHAMCPCHRIDHYDYEHSMEKVEEERQGRLDELRKSSQRYIEVREENNGIGCTNIAGSMQESGMKSVRGFDLRDCFNGGKHGGSCQLAFCYVRQKPRDLSKVNIFFDVRRTWIVHTGILTEKKVEITRGYRAFDRSVARTDAELLLKYKKAEFNPLEHRHYMEVRIPQERQRLSKEDACYERASQMHSKTRGCRLNDWFPDYDYFEFFMEYENVRIERIETRDIYQDLQDTANGIEVHHASDVAESNPGGETAFVNKLKRMVSKKPWNKIKKADKERIIAMFGEEDTKKMVHEQRRERFRKKLHDIEHYRRVLLPDELEEYEAFLAYEEELQAKAKAEEEAARAEEEAKREADKAQISLW